MKKAYLIGLLVFELIIFCSCTHNVNSLPEFSEPQPPMEEDSSEENVSFSVSSYSSSKEKASESSTDLYDELNNSQTVQSEAETSTAPSTVVGNYAAIGKDIPWGNVNDTLKTYTDHDGKQQYQDYTMLTWMMLPDSTSKKITLTANIVGSQFLTDLQNMKPVNPRELTHSSEFVTFLSIKDGNDTVIYSFYENGDIYTEQYGKQYYLGADAFSVHFYTMVFASAAFDSFTTDVNLPDFDYGQQRGNTMDKGSINQYIREYAASDYQVYYVATNYDRQSAPLLIENAENKEYILQTLSSSWISTTSGYSTGAGQIVRLHNKSETLNFMIANDYMINYQIANESIVFQLPEDFFRKLQFIAATEIAYKLSA